MKAMRMHGYGVPAMIHEDEIDRPSPGPGEVLLRTAATTFNPSEAGLRQGLLRSIIPLDLPYTMGLDVAGTVVAVGDPVVEPPGAGDRVGASFGVGDRVIGRLDGGAAADFAVAPAEALVRVPAEVNLEEAAALPIAGLTAWQAVFEHGAVTAGQRVLVNGTGTIGRYAAQLAEHAGAHVTVVGRGGAPGTEPVDVFLHLVPAAPGHTGVIRPGGVLVSVTTPVDQLPPGGFRPVHFIVRNDTAQLGEMLKLVAAGAIRIDIADRRPLADLAAVHEAAESGRLPGKTLLLPGH
ncbi:NADP-dependent oxidoreductase [Actinoplanes subglobosus]|uniref:NADP-dependent oxidoreductase n=1 Tax=Actinoplanes subglobosus TaxID=1547892 RepID=A0ABV8J0X8_9ACTN